MLHVLAVISFSHELFLAHDWEHAWFETVDVVKKLRVCMKIFDRCI